MIYDKDVLPMVSRSSKMIMAVRLLLRGLLLRGLSVLRLSYCDRSLSIVSRASSIVHKLFYLNTFSSETAHWILT